MINQCIVSGNVGKKPEIKKFESGKQLARFSIAVNQYSKTNDQPESLWLDIECWDGVAERLQKCDLDEGKRITVVGSVAPNVYRQTIGSESITHRRVKLKMRLLRALVIKSPKRLSRRRSF
jgi:single-stranded DNA-binding protein